MCALRVALSIILSSAVCGCAGDRGAEPVYALRQDSSGSSGIQPTIAMGAFPFRSEYAQLSPSDVARLRRYFPKLGVADEPPYPLGGLKSIYAPLAEGAQRMTIRGEVELLVHVDASGSAKEVSVIRTTDNALAHYVAAASLFTKYKPATCSGTPCPSYFPVKVGFR